MSVYPRVMLAKKIFRERQKKLVYNGRRAFEIQVHRQINSPINTSNSKLLCKTFSYFHLSLSTLHIVDTHRAWLSGITLEKY